MFFGGGTPSLLRPDQLATILDGVVRAPGAEVTVECNPDSVDLEKLRGYRAAGVDRVSFGVQSMTPHVLAALGRTHDPANVARAVADARTAGIGEVNLDLIYGTPGESLADWEASVRGAIALQPDHVSAYALTVEPGTPLGAQVRAGAAAPDDDDQADKYELADDLLGEAGYDWYEISNWARPGAECAHNRLYWTMGEYLAVGCAAHGHEAGRRYWHVRTPERWIEAVRAGTSPEAGSESLDAAARTEEAIVLALRTNAGIPEPGPGSPGRAEIDDLVTAGLLQRQRAGASQRLVLTRAGRLLASDVTARVVLSGVGTHYD